MLNRMSASKHFASKRDVQTVPTVEFSVEFVRDNVAESHDFTARPRTSYGDVLGLIRHQGDDSGRALPHLDNLIRRSLLNTDGTPEKWRPEIKDGEFVNPDGTTCPVDDLPKYLTFEAGSSRRRWVQLMQFDDDVEVEIEQIAGVFEYLAGAAAERPTSPSSP